MSIREDVGKFWTAVLQNFLLSVLRNFASFRLRADEQSTHGGKDISYSTRPPCVGELIMKLGENGPYMAAVYTPRTSGTTDQYSTRQPSVQ